MRYPTCQQLPRRPALFDASVTTVCLFFFVIGRVLTRLDPAHGHTCDVASPTKKPIVKVAVDVKEAQATKKTRGSDMVAEGMM